MRVKQKSKRKIAADTAAARHSRKKRKGKSKLPVEAMRLLRQTWLDGDIWQSDKFLSDLLGEFLGEASERGCKVQPQDWEEAALECVQWSIGKNKGPQTEQGASS